MHIDEEPRHLTRAPLVLAQDYAELKEFAPHLFTQLLGQPTLFFSEADLISAKIRPDDDILKEIPRHWINIIDVLGRGAFGMVYKAMLKSETTTPGYIVAVKALHEKDGMLQHRSMLLQEAMVMAGLSHPHIVRLVGVVTKGDPIMVVIEYCEFGSLSRLVRSTELSSPMKKRMAADIADGMAYLHSQGIVHRDLAARNVLVSSDRRAKVCDYGLSRVLGGKDYYRSRGGLNSVRWTAPEALEQQLYSEASDVWSFGVVMYEIWSSGLVPYGEMHERAVWADVCNGLRLPCPANCSPDIYKIMRLCWRLNSAERPRFVKLTEKLRRLEISTIQAELHARFANQSLDIQSDEAPIDTETTNHDQIDDEQAVSLRVEIPIEFLQQALSLPAEEADNARLTDI